MDSHLEMLEVEQQINLIEKQHNFFICSKWVCDKCNKIYESPGDSKDKSCINCNICKRCNKIYPITNYNDTKCCFKCTLRFLEILKKEETKL